MSSPWFERRIPRSAIAALLPIIFFACGGGAPSGGSPYIAPSPQPRTVQGRSGLVQIYGTTETHIPTDLSMATISAWTIGGGTYEITGGTGLADGTFSIPNVPMGSCLVEIQPAIGFPTFYQVNGTSLDLESLSLGDPSVPMAAQTSTQLLLDPAAPGMSITSFDLVSEKSGLVLSVPGLAASRPIYWTGKPLLTTTRETDLIITGLRSTTTPVGDTCSYIQGYDQSFITPFNMADGATTTISANLIIQGAPSSVTILVDRDAFCGTTLASQAASGTTLTTSLVAQPLGVSSGPLSQVRLLTHTTTTLAGPLNTGALFYGDPFPAAWTRVLRVDYVSPIPISPPGSTYSTSFQMGIVSQWRTIEIPTSGALKPIVGAVGNFKVNNLSLMQPQSGVGLTPTLSWDAPTTGTAAFYTVFIYSLTKQATAASILTQQTSLQIPPQVMISGESYLFWINATYWPGFDLSKPKAASWPYGRASLMSGTVTP